MAAGRVAALTAAVVVTVVPLLLAGVARADCFDYCFKNCIANDKSMTDYCNYACDKTCDPGAPQRPLLAAAAGDMGCQFSCARTSCSRLRPDCKALETCFGQCYDGCNTKTLPRPLRARTRAGAGVPTALPASEPDPDDAASEKHPFHEKQDAVRRRRSPTRTMPPVLHRSRKMTPSGHHRRRPTRTAQSFRDRHPTWTATSTRSRTASSPRQSRTRTTPSRHRRSMPLLRRLCNSN